MTDEIKVGDQVWHILATKEGYKPVKYTVIGQTLRRTEIAIGRGFISVATETILHSEKEAYAQAMDMTMWRINSLKSSLDDCTKTYKELEEKWEQITAQK